VDLTRQTKTTIETTIGTTPGTTCSIYSAHYLGDRVFAGPFSNNVKAKTNTTTIDESKLSNSNTKEVEKYIRVAKVKHDYDTEQALGMLAWHDGNINKATKDLANFEPSCELAEGEETGSGGENDTSINNYDERYYYQCAFCPTKLKDGKDLKTHIESRHSEEMFKFPCQACGFQAKGPKFLREHVEEAHNKSETKPQTIGNGSREGKSARTTQYKFGNRFPTTGWNEQPERWAEPGPGIVWKLRPGSKKRRIAQNKKKTELATSFD
jgi:uncharacterized C2H2 Zn-finger protein